MKTLVKIFIAAILILFIAYLIVMNLPKASSSGKVSDYKIQATELYAEFNADEGAANKKYIGKTIEVSGQVLNTHRDQQNALVIIMDAGNAMGSILCTLEKDPPSIPEKGQSVTIKGQCNGLLMDVVLNKCVLLNN